MRAMQTSTRAWHLPTFTTAQLLFMLTGVTIAYLVLPPFFFILQTSLVVDRGIQAGSFTIRHFENIVESLGDVKTLLLNSMAFSVGSAALALGLDEIFKMPDREAAGL